MQQLLAVFDLPGPAGQRLNHLTIDNEDHYLPSTHLGAGLLDVIDLRAHGVYAPGQAEQGKPVARIVAYEAVIQCSDPHAHKPDAVLSSFSLLYVRFRARTTTKTIKEATAAHVTNTKTINSRSN